jgi:hypothetical protein
MAIEFNDHEDLVKIARFLVNVLDWKARDIVAFFDEPHKYKKYFSLAELYDEERDHYTVACDECGDSQEIKDDGTIDWEDGTAYITCKSVSCPSNAEMQEVTL